MRFWQRRPRFSDRPRETGVHGAAADVVDSRGLLRTLPHVHALEAFFGAVFARHG